jgi:hypothetical protein
VAEADRSAMTMQYSAEKMQFACEITEARKSTGQLKCDGTCAETRFRLSAKRRSPFKSAGASVQ